MQNSLKPWFHYGTFFMVPLSFAIAMPEGALDVVRNSLNLLELEIDL